MISIEMKRLTPFWVVMISIMLITVVGCLLAMVVPIDIFGAQGGEMVQLQTSYVPTIDDVVNWRANASK
jgi:hypothetical protein